MRFTFIYIVGDFEDAPASHFTFDRIAHPPSFLRTNEALFRLRASGTADRFRARRGSLKHFLQFFCGASPLSGGPSATLLLAWPKGTRPRSTAKGDLRCRPSFPLDEQNPTGPRSRRSARRSLRYFWNLVLVLARLHGCGVSTDSARSLQPQAARWGRRVGLSILSQYG